MTNRRWKFRRTEHEIVSEQLSEYLDEQLEAGERARVERHLATCAECQESVRSLRWTRQLLRQAPTARIPRSFVVREADVAPARAAGRRRPVAALQWAGAVVAALLVLVFAGDLLTGRLLTSARPVSAPVVAYERAREDQAVETQEAVAVEEGTPSAAAEQALQAAGAPSPTEEAAVKMAAPEKQLGPTGVEAAPTGTPPPMGLVAPSATLPGEQTPTVVAAPSEQDRGAIPPEADMTAEAQEQTLAASAAMAAEAPSVTPAPGYQGRPLRPLGTWLTAWRAAEIGLGTILLALLIAAIWTRLRR